MSSNRYNRAALAAVSCISILVANQGQVLAADHGHDHSHDFVDNDFLTYDIRRAAFEVEDFVAKFETPNLQSPGGSITSQGLNSRPVIGAIRGGGVPTTVYELEPCGVINPHIHPGGTESIFVFEGSLTVGFVGNMRVLETDVHTREGFQVPMGLMHWLENKSCDQKASAHLSFPANDPGIILSANALFSMPDSVLYATFPTLSKAELEAVKTAAMGAPVPAVNQECVKQCEEARGRDGGYGSE